MLWLAYSINQACIREVPRDTGPNIKVSGANIIWTNAGPRWAPWWPHEPCSQDQYPRPKVSRPRSCLLPGFWTHCIQLVRQTQNRQNLKRYWKKILAAEVITKLCKLLPSYASQRHLISTLFFIISVTFFHARWENWDIIILLCRVKVGRIPWKWDQLPRMYMINPWHTFYDTHSRLVCEEHTNNTILLHVVPM